MSSHLLITCPTRTWSCCISKCIRCLQNLWWLGFVRFQKRHRGTIYSIVSSFLLFLFLYSWQQRRRGFFDHYWFVCGYLGVL